MNSSFNSFPDSSELRDTGGGVGDRVVFQFLSGFQPIETGILRPYQYLPFNSFPDSREEIELTEKFEDFLDFQFLSGFQTR